MGSLLFFAAPPLYRIIDPTAGSFDAGYIHAIIYAAVVVSFASGFAWLLTRLIAPGTFKLTDKWLEHEHPTITDSVKYTLIIFFLFFYSTVAIVCAII